MYLHLGDNVAVPARYVIGVFDLETSKVAKDTCDFLEKAQKSNHVCDICDDIPKAFVVVEKTPRCLRTPPPFKRGQSVYITQIATGTLRKRM